MLEVLIVLGCIVAMTLGMSWLAQKRYARKLRREQEEEDDDEVPEELRNYMDTSLAFSGRVYTRRDPILLRHDGEIWVRERDMRKHPAWNDHDGEYLVGLQILNGRHIDIAEYTRGYSANLTLSWVKPIYNYRGFDTRIEIVDIGVFFPNEKVLLTMIEYGEVLRGERRRPAGSHSVAQYAKIVKV